MPERIRDGLSVILVYNNEEPFFTSEKDEWNVTTEQNDERDLRDVALPVRFTLVIYR